MKKIILAAGLGLVVSTPVMADEYYIVRGPDKECRVVETRPADTTIVQVGPLAFKARDEAEREMRVVCKEMYESREPNVVIRREVDREPDVIVEKEVIRRERY
jgi:hypothetical protein